MGIHLGKLGEIIGWVSQIGFQKCSKTILEGPPIERCSEQMKFDLEEVKENSKYKSSWKSNKELKQRKRQVWRVKCFQSINNLWRGQGQGKGGKP
jgi:hypothetical protein